MSDKITPVIDWELGKKLVNNNEDAAIEMLQLLVKSLAEEYNNIKQSFEANNTKELLSLVHKLHGAVCYVGVPRLQIALKKLEFCLKNNESTDIKTLFNNFEHEVQEVLKVSIPHA